jgi:gag-polypeptide of LTR copia-type
MATVSEFSTNRYTSGKSLDMYVAEFESLSMRMEAVGQPVSEALLVANFINSLSNVTVLHAFLSALRATEDLTWTKVSTQVLHEEDLKGLNRRGRIYNLEERVMAASSGFDGECFHCGEYGHRASDNNDESSRNFTKSQGGIGEHRRGPRRQNDRQGYRQDRARPGGARKGSDQNARYQRIEKGDYQSEPRLLSPPLTMSETGFHPPALRWTLAPQGT